MNALPILIPLADGQHLPLTVLGALGRQTVSVAIRPCTRPEGPHRRYGEAHSRNALLTVAGALPAGNVVCMLDRDVLLTDVHALERAVTLLSTTVDVMAVHLRYKEGLTEKHMDIGAVVFSNHLAADLWFDPERETCHCESFTQCLNRVGGKQVYLSDALQGTEYNVFNGG